MRRYRIYRNVELLLVIIFDLITYILFLPAILIRFLRKSTVKNYSSSSIKKIIIFRTDRIGDLVMTLPAIRLLRNKYKDARIDLVAGSWNKAILKDFEAVDYIHCWNPSWISREKINHSFYNLVLQAFKLRKERFDLAIDFASDIRINILLWITGTPRRIGYTDSGGGALLTDLVREKGIHRVEQNLQPLKKIGAVDEAKVELAGQLDHIKTNPESMNFLAKKYGIDLKKKIIVIHPWGGRLVKTWPPEYYSEVISKINSDGRFNILLTGSSDERHFIDQIKQNMRSYLLDLSGKIGIEDFITLIRRADLFISPDTGPAHIAVACGTPSITLFGPSDLKKYAPYGERKKHRIIAAKGMDCLYCNRIRKPPSSCIEDGYSVCMRKIAPETVIREICDMLKINNRDFINAHR